MPNVELIKSPRRRPAPKNRSCVVDGCRRPHVARGWCHRHYTRWHRHGDPLLGTDLNDGPLAEGPAEKPCRDCGGPKQRGRGRSLCDDCAEAASVVQHEKNTRHARDRELRRKYGIDLQQYDEILARQGGLCAICRGLPTKSFRCFDVDHGHDTGKVRGLLCRRCNTGLGYIEAGFHEQALAYLGGASPRQT